jgi:hypothetical protein
LSLLGSDGSQRRTELAGYGMPRRLLLAQRSRLARKVAVLEGRLFDHEGHVHQGLSEEVATTRLNEINDLRRNLGWLSVDRHHDYVWPTDIAS